MLQLEGFVFSVQDKPVSSDSEQASKRGLCACAALRLPDPDGSGTRVIAPPHAAVHPTVPCVSRAPILTRDLRGLSGPARPPRAACDLTRSPS